MEGKLKEKKSERETSYERVLTIGNKQVFWRGSGGG